MQKKEEILLLPHKTSQADHYKHYRLFLCLSHPVNATAKHFQAGSQARYSTLTTLYEAGHYCRSNRQ